MRQYVFSHEELQKILNNAYEYGYVYGLNEREKFKNQRQVERRLPYLHAPLGKIIDGIKPPPPNNIFE